MKYSLDMLVSPGVLQAHTSIACAVESGNTDASKVLPRIEESFITNPDIQLSLIDQTQINYLNLKLG